MAEPAQIEQRELVRELRDRLRRLDEERQRLEAQLAALEQQASVGTVEQKPLRAHPVTGEVDHEALTREIIARFPNILAALAE